MGSGWPIKLCREGRVGHHHETQRGSRRWAGRWPKQGDGSAFHSCAVVLSPRLSPRTQAQPRCTGRHRRVRIACVRAAEPSERCAERALCRASAVPSEHSGCGVRTSMWPVVAVMHADNGAGPSVDVPCGLCTGREARRCGRCTGMLRQWQRQQGQRRQQRQLCRSPARALVPELRMKIQQ